MGHPPHGIGRDIRRIWGKLGYGKWPLIPHPLICHMFDTAMVAMRLWTVALGPQLRRELETAFAPLGDARAWVALLCGLHDLGKCSPTFQGVRLEEAISFLGPDSKEAASVRHAAGGPHRGYRADTHHARITAVYMHDIVKAWGAPHATARMIAEALGGHHGMIPSPAAIQDARNAKGHLDPDVWQPWVDDHVDQLITMLGLPEPTTLAWQQVRFSLVAQLALVAFTSVCDHVASDLKKADHAGIDVDLGAYVDESKRTQNAKVDRLHWSPWIPPSDTRFDALFASVKNPFPIQRTVESVIAQITEPGVLVVAAPTGEGKTKAALQALTHFIKVLNLDGFYFALPTRASSNQAFAVASGMLADLDHDDPLRLLHAKAKEGFEQSLRDGELPRPRGIDQDGETNDGAKDTQFFVNSQGLLAPLGIGTVDQALKAVLKSRYAYMRLAGLAGKAVVFDEVHGYDVHMSTIFERLLQWLGRLRVPVILLSATLSHGQQHRLIANWHAGARGVPVEAVDVPSVEDARYPRVVWAGASSKSLTVEEPGTSELNGERQVHIPHVDWDERASWAVDQALQGRNVAMIHNGVQDAIEAHASVRNANAERGLDLPEPVLLYGNVPDRQRAEAKVLDALGRGKSRPKGLIVMGTQLLEESLDVSFDAMISAVAPVDALIQRAGRLQRHGRTTQEPLTMALTGVVENGRRITFKARVYAKAVLLRTWALLRERPFINCPNDVQSLIDDVYDTPENIAYPPQWRRERDIAELNLRKMLAKGTYHPRVSRVPFPSPDRALYEMTYHPRGSQTRPQVLREDDQ